MMQVITDKDIRAWAKLSKGNRHLYKIYAEYKKQAKQEWDSGKGFAYIEKSARRDLVRMQIVNLIQCGVIENEVS